MSVYWVYHYIQDLKMQRSCWRFPLHSGSSECILFWYWCRRAKDEIMPGLSLFNCTVWSADSSSNESQAPVGTNLGAALVSLATGAPSWVLLCKSDVLSVEFDQSGKNILYGLRNGAIVTIDTRQRSDRISTRLSKHDIPFSFRGSGKPSHRTAQSSTNRRFEIRLYDQRLIQKGPVQSYEGHVNSHTRIGFGIDPYEKYVMSGGEDNNLRLWSIKSGQLLYENRFMHYIPSVLCWPKGRRNNIAQT